MHNYYIDFLKSFKAFIANAFPDINHYQFNYSDKSYLSYKLYKNHITEFPSCHINLSSIKINDDTNHAFFRSIYNQFNENTIQHIANNNTKQESVLLDFKWVNLFIDVKINLDNPADIFNYNNIILSTLPQNYMFYDYTYNAYIELDSVSTNWEPTDDVENVVYRAIDGTIKKYALYSNQPIFKVLNHDKQKTVEGSVDNAGDGVNISFDIQLKVPNIIGKNSIDTNRIDGIQIIINTSDHDTNLPILIDMNNDIYSSNKNKASKIISLSKKDFSEDKSEVLLTQGTKDLLYGKSAAIYIVDDSSKPASDVTILYFELGYFEKDSLIDKNSIVLNPQYKQELKDIVLNEFSFIEIITFN